MDHSGPYPRRDSTMNNLSLNSNYQSSPSTVCMTPTQPLQAPMMAMSPIGATMLPPRYRHNSTALTYTFEQLSNSMWQQHPSQARGLAPGGSYTDLITGQTFTHDQMMAITQPRQPCQPMQSVQHQFQQPSQQQVHTSSHGYNTQKCTYQQTMPLQQHQICQMRQMQQVQAAHIQAQMMQQRQMQQVQGQQWAQQSMPQQQTQPKKHLLYQTTNTGQMVVADQYGHQWTQEQYRELLRRQQLQMAQFSAAVSPLLQQGQDMPQVSPPMTVSQRPINNAARPLTPWPHAEFRQRQQMNIQSPQAFIHPRSQVQPQPALPVMTSCPQQPVHPAPSECQLAPKQLSEMIRVRQAQKSVLPPNRPFNGAKVPIPAKPSTQPAIHKQGVRKPQKQPRLLPALVPAPPKTPEATQTVQQTNTGPVTPKSSHSTMAPPICKTNMAPPPVPRGRRSRPVSRASTPASPSVASPRHSPHLTTNSPCPSTSKTDVDSTELDLDAAIREELMQYLSDCYKYASEDTSSQDSIASGSSSSCLSSSPQPSTTPSSTTNTPATTATSTTSSTMTTPATTNTPPPTSTTIPSTTSPTTTPPTPTISIPSPRSPSPHSMLTNCAYALFTSHQDICNNAYPGFAGYDDSHALVAAVAVVEGEEEQRDPSRAPEERGMSEERAQLEWDIMVTGGRYAGVFTEEHGREEEEVVGLTGSGVEGEGGVCG